VWPFRRGRSRPVESTVESAPARRRDWEILPTVQRMVPPMALTIDPPGFEASLDTRRPVPFLQPLGHTLSPGAPGGIVNGFLAPTTSAPKASPGSGLALDLRRRPKNPAAFWRSAPVDDFEASAIAPGEASWNLGEAPGSTVATPDVAPIHSVAPVRALPATRGAAPTQRSMVDAPSPALLVHRQLFADLTAHVDHPAPSTTEGPSSAPDGSTAPPDPVEPQPAYAEKVGATDARGTPPAEPTPKTADLVVGRTAQRRPADVEATPGSRPSDPTAAPAPGPSAAMPPNEAAVSSSSHTTAPELPLRPRRLGLGPPVQRQMAGPFVPPPSSLAPQSTALPKPAHEPGPATAPASSGTRELTPHHQQALPLPGETPGSSPAAAVPASPATRTAPPDPPADASAASAGDAPPATGIETAHLAVHQPERNRRALPTLDLRPISLSSVQRAPEEAPAGVRRAVEAETGVDLSGVPVHRGAESTQVAAALQARAFTDEGAVHVPAHHGSLDTGGGAGLLAHELVHVAQQRRLGPARPAEETAGGRALEHQAQRVEHLVQRTAGSPTGGTRTTAVSHLPLAQPHSDPRAAALATGLASLDADGAVVFRSPPPSSATAPAPHGSGGPGPQRAPEAPEAPASLPTEVAPAISATATGSAAANPSNEQLEELAKKLYDKLRERLRAELRFDRERCGRLTDLAR